MIPCFVTAETECMQKIAPMPHKRLADLWFVVRDFTRGGLHVSML